MIEVERHYLACLAQASYIVVADGEAAVIDPRRDVDEYLEAAATRGFRIRWVIETHLHADFVSGHRELADRAGARIVFGRAAGVSFPHEAVADGDELPLGRARLRVLETPGHTPESICVVAIDESGTPRHVFTGDTLFLGDVGRPDLATASGWSPERMAAALHDSLHAKLLALPDDVEVHPAHGAGSLCGRSISADASSTIGEQRRTNPALQPMDREQFVAMMTADLPPQPRYFARDAELNRQGPRALDEMARPANLSAAEVARRLREGALLVDVRPRERHASAHVAGSLAIGLQGQFAAWAGALLDASKPLIVVAADEAQRDEALLRLARVGLDQVAGVLGEDAEAWRAGGLDVRTTSEVPAAGLAAGGGRDRIVVDVRRPAEHVAGHVPGALSAPLDRLGQAPPPALLALPRDASLDVICQSGYRSTAALGLLEGLGFRRLRNVSDGHAGWTDAGMPMERSEAGAAPARSCPTSS